MYFLNLSAAEFVTLLGAAAVLVTALYLLDRKAQVRVVSTLRFWQTAPAANQNPAPRRIREPWSFLLLLLSLTLLSLAIAQIQFGKRSPVQSDVVLLDTSYSARHALQQEKQLAIEYIKRLPARDRVMLVEVSGLVVPATGFTVDRQLLMGRINTATSDETATDIEHALRFANEARSNSGPEAGEVVYIGPQQVSEDPVARVSKLRLLPVASNVEQPVISSFTALADAEPNAWQATVAVHNYSAVPVRATLELRFAATRFAPRVIQLAPGAELQSSYQFEASGAGELSAYLDNTQSRARLHLPSNAAVRVDVITARSNVWQPLLNANSRLQVHYSLPTAKQRDVPADVTVVDVSASFPDIDGPTLWINSKRSPQPGHVAVIRFDPLAGSLRYQAATPLLIANALESLVPGSFKRDALECRTVGPVHLPLTDVIGIADEDGKRVPFTNRSGAVDFFVQHPANLHVATASGERQISFTLPEVAHVFWRPQHAVIGLPSQAAHLARDTWRLFVVVAMLLLLLEWLLYGRRAQRLNIPRTVFKVASVIIALLALTQPAVRVPDTHSKISLLVDRSLGDAAKRSARIIRHRGSTELSLVPWNGNDLELGLTEAAAQLPNPSTGRIILLSNGTQITGSATRAIAEMRSAGTPVDVLPSGDVQTAQFAISSLTLPHELFSGEEATLHAVIHSPHQAHATVHIEADGKPLGSTKVDLKQGDNAIDIKTRVNASGAVQLSLLVSGPGLADARWTNAVQITRPRALYLSQDPPGTGTNLLGALRAAQFQVSEDPDALNNSLSAIQLLILSNLDLNSLSAAQKTNISQYVQAGGGLILLGGERQVYKEDKQMDVLDRILPAKLAPPRNPEGICVVLIIDKSSSMEGRKIELAKLSAVGVVDHLRPIDTIGVLIFDNSHEWAVPLRKAVDKTSINNLISAINADGGTQIAPALSEAYRRILHTLHPYKHIVLLTDGISEEGDSIEIAKQAASKHVTVSTVGLGQDVNRPYLEKIAATSGGKSYFLTDPQGLQQLLLNDVQKYTGSTAVEQPLVPLLKNKAELLAGLDIEHAPALKGYARYVAKPGSETLLGIGTDPLLVRWQYGLGHVAVFTSDAKSRWAADWITWPGFDRFWSNLARAAVDRENQTTATAQLDAGQSELVAEYHLPPSETRMPPPLFVLGPNGFTKLLPLKRISQNVYRGQVPLGDVTGFFRIRPVEDSAAFPEIGLYLPAASTRKTELNEPLLRELASATGGRYDPSPPTLFNQSLPVRYIRIDLWPALLALVMAITIAEVILRKWPGLRARFSGWWKLRPARSTR